MVTNPRWRTSWFPIVCCCYLALNLSKASDLRISASYGKTWTSPWYSGMFIGMWSHRTCECVRVRVKYLKPHNSDITLRSNKNVRLRKFFLSRIDNYLYRKCVANLPFIRQKVVTQIFRLRSVWGRMLYTQRKVGLGTWGTRLPS